MLALARQGLVWQRTATALGAVAPWPPRDVSVAKDAGHWCRLSTHRPARRSPSGPTIPSCGQARRRGRRGRGGRGCGGEPAPDEPPPAPTDTDAMRPPHAETPRRHGRQDSAALPSRHCGVAALRQESAGACAGWPSACAFLSMENGHRMRSLTALAGVTVIAALAARPAFAQSSELRHAEVSAGWSLLRHVLPFLVVEIGSARCTHSSSSHAPERRRCWCCRGE